MGIKTGWSPMKKEQYRHRVKKAIDLLLQRFKCTKAQLNDHVNRMLSENDCMKSKIEEQKDKIEEQKKEIDELKEKVTELENLQSLVKD